MRYVENGVFLPPQQLEQIIKNNLLIVTLRIKYSFTLKLQICIDNNKFEVSDMEKFITYLGIQNLILISECKKCKSFIISNELQFDHRGFVKPVILKREGICLIDGDKNYDLMTEFSKNKTGLRLFDDKGIMEMDLPLLPLYKFKSRDKLLRKLKMCVVFS